MGSSDAPQPTLSTQDPGKMDPGQLNPYAGKYISNNSALYSQFQNSAAGGAFNPSFYAGMQDTQQKQLTSSLGNQYASMGLAGSSAEMGGMNQAIQSNQMNWLNRQQSDQMRALSGLEGLNQQGYSETMGIQNQFGNYQNAMNQNALSLAGMQQQQQMSNQQNTAGMISAGIGAAGMVGGMMMAGPAGGYAGHYAGDLSGSLMGMNSMRGPSMPGATSDQPYYLRGDDN